MTITNFDKWCGESAQYFVTLYKAVSVFPFHHHHPVQFTEFFFPGVLHRLLTGSHAVTHAAL